MDKSTILKTIADNPALMDELKKLFQAEFETPGMDVHLSNESLGEMVKARLMGLSAIEEVFSKILEYRTPQPKVEGKNPGR